MKIFAYVRCSTNKQDEASQRQIINDAYQSADKSNWRWYSDTASGGTPWQSRAIASALENAQPGDVILVSEVSRIARSTVGVLTFLQDAAARGVQVEAIRTGIKLDGSMQAKIVVTVLGLAAEIERDLLRARTKAAMDARKSRGLPVGRQTGATGLRNKLATRAAEIDQLIAARVSVSAIARICQVSRQTLHAYLAAKKATKQTNESEVKNVV